jgi:putative tryptophan/tyrosine transport system substrate-binding protein
VSVRLLDTADHCIKLATLSTDPPSASIAPTMNRRTFVTGLGAVLAGPRAAEAQPRNVPLVVFVAPASEQDAYAARNTAVFRQTLVEAGYTEGKTRLEVRYLGGRVDRLPEVLADSVARGADVIVVAGTMAAVAAKQATTTIPIVFMGVGDPVEAGIVSSLNRPAGNLTGITWGASPQDHAKMLQLLREAVPNVRRVAQIYGKGDAIEPSKNPISLATDAAAASMGIVIQRHPVDTQADLNRELSLIGRNAPHALVVSGATPTYVHRRIITDFALRNRLPSIHQFPEAVVDGALMSYGPSMREFMQRAALYVDKILRGAKPAELPVEEPTRFDIVINAKTAKALGLTIQPSLLLRADQVIE